MARWLSISLSLLYHHRHRPQPQPQPPCPISPHHHQDHHHHVLSRTSSSSCPCYSAAIFPHVPSISRIIKRRRRSLPPSLAVPRTSLARSLARPIHTMVSTHPSVAVIAFTTQRWQSLTLCVRYECRGSSCAATSMRPSGCSRRSRSSPRSYVLERHWLAGWLARWLLDRSVD